MSSLSKHDTKLKDSLDAIITEMIEKGILFNDAVRNFEKQYIAKVLKMNNGNLKRTADDLGIHRNTLSRKVVKYRISI